MRSYASRSGFVIGFLFFSLFFSVTTLLPGQSLAVDFSDDFDDNIKSTGIWGADRLNGIGRLKEKNQRLEYTISSPNAGDFILRPLHGGIGPYNASWETQIDLFNSTNPANKRYSSFGFSIIKCGNSRHELYTELYAYGGNSATENPLGKGFYAALFANNTFAGEADTLDLGLNPLAGAVRIVFDGLTKIFTVLYDTGGGEIQLGSFGVSVAGGGTNGNGSWDMDDTSAFCIGVYGYADRMTVASGAVYGDNFSASGLTPASVVLLQPNGGETITPGPTPYQIEWLAPPDAQTFKLKLSVDNGLTWSLIDPNPVSGTSYNWTVTPPSKNKQQCLVKVIAYAGNNAKVGSDKSDSAFAIEVLKLTSPNGGELLTSNSPHTITWTTNATAAPVDHIILSYTLNNGRTWKKIDTSGDPTDDGSFSWIVPQVSGEKETCKVKIVLKDASGKTVGKDVSDELFTILP